MSEGSVIARVKGVCSQQTIQRMMSLVINAMRRQRETDGDREVVRKTTVSTAGRIDQEEQKEHGQLQAV